MNVEETLEALHAIGLRGQVQPTGHPDFIRVFALDHQGVTQGRLTIHCGQYSHAKWYVEKIQSGSVLSDERIPFAWSLWLQNRECLDETRWNDVVAFAIQSAQAEREEKQRLREVNGTKTRRRLAFPVRKHIRLALFGAPRG